MSSSNVIWKRLLKRSIWGIGPLVFILIMATCQPIQQAPTAPTATPEQSQATSAGAITSTNTNTATASVTSTGALTGRSEVTSTSTVTSSGTVTNTGTTTGTSGMQGSPEAGAYIVAISGGCGCHFNRELGGFAGGNKFEGPDGVVYSANITPDKDTGIGEWTPEQIARVLLTGVDDQGKPLAPVMPYRTFNALSKQEAMDVTAYLLSLKPIANQVPPRELKQEPAPFTPTQASPAEPLTDPVARGKEVVTIASCSSCHTPKSADGSPKADIFLAGAPLRGEEVAANITPDAETGIGKWSQEQIATFLRTGKLPDGKQVEGAMAQQIDRRFSKLTETDAAAVAAYLKSIPAVKNQPRVK